MNAVRIDIPNPLFKVQLTLSSEEAQLLKRMTWYDVSIPDAMRKAGEQDTKTIGLFLLELKKTLAEAF